MRLMKLFAFAVILAGFGLVVEAETASAHPRFGCEAVAFRINGSFVRGSRTEAVAGRERRACRRALRRCERRLDDIRFHRGRPMPFARCEVVDVYRIRHSHH